MLIARDSENKIMWIKGRTDISPLTYREFNEGRDMTSGYIKKDGIRYLPPITCREEDGTYLSPLFTKQYTNHSVCGME